MLLWLSSLSETDKFVNVYIGSPMLHKNRTKCKSPLQDIENDWYDFQTNVFRVLRQQFGGKLLILRQTEVFWYIGTTMEEIDEELVIKLSVWKKTKSKSVMNLGRILDREKKLFY